MPARMPDAPSRSTGLSGEARGCPLYASTAAGSPSSASTTDRRRVEQAEPGTEQRAAAHQRGARGARVERHLDQPDEVARIAHAASARSASAIDRAVRPRPGERRARNGPLGRIDHHADRRERHAVPRGRVAPPRGIPCRPRSRRSAGAGSRLAAACAIGSRTPAIGPWTAPGMMRISRCAQRASVGRSTLVVENGRADDAGAGLEIGREAARDAEADQAAATGRHRARQRCREILPVAAADDRNAEARRDAGLESHPHHHNHSAAPPRAALHTERHRPTVSALQIAIARHRPEREEFPIAVIAQIEDAGKAGRGVSLLVPQAVGALSLRQDRRCRVRPPDGRPRRPPSGRARPMPSARRCSAPARSPGSRACSSRRPRPSRRPRSGSRAASRPPCGPSARLVIDAGGVERAQHRPGAVDVVHAPAAVPASVRLLVAPSQAIARRIGSEVAGRSPSCASIETQRAVTSAVGGSSSAPWSANGMLLR